MEEETPLWTNPFALLGLLVAMGATGMTVIAVLIWGDGGTVSIVTLGVAALMLTLVTGLIAIARLETYVSSRGIEVTFRPLKRVSLGFDELTSATACSYQPVRDFGGWGVRRRKERRLLATAGNEGVRLVLRNGESLTIGSFDAQGLARAIREHAEKAGNPVGVEADAPDSIEP